MLRNVNLRLGHAAGPCKHNAQAITFSLTDPSVRKDLHHYPLVSPALWNPVQPQPSYSIHQAWPDQCMVYWLTKLHSYRMPLQTATLTYLPSTKPSVCNNSLLSHRIHLMHLYPDVGMMYNSDTTSSNRIVTLSLCDDVL